MSIRVPAYGRGAWTATGKLNRSRYYDWLDSKRLDGTNAPADGNFYAARAPHRAAG